MTSDLREDDVVVHISSPQIISTEGGGGGGARAQASSAAAELGRRLLAAARLGDTAAVRDLMARGAPFTADWLGTTALHLAAGGAHLDTCGALLRGGVSRDARTKVERTALHAAAAGGHAAVAALLLARGARPDPRDLLRMTPLHWAAQRGHAAAARVLLRHGADPRALSKFGKTPRALAVGAGHRDAVRAIDEALRDREAAASVSAIVDGDRADRAAESPAEEPRPCEPPQRLQETKHVEKREKPIKVQMDSEEAASAGEEGGGGGGSGSGTTGSGAQLLAKHGICLLPADEGSTVLSALQSGRTVVLSDAGKLMLRESGARGALQRVRCAPPQRAAPPPPATPPQAARPPRPAVKIIMNKASFSKLLASATRIDQAGGAGGAGGAPAQCERDGKSALRPRSDAAGGGASESACGGATGAGGASERARCECRALRAALADTSAALEAARARLRRYEPDVDVDTDTDTGH